MNGQEGLLQEQLIRLRLEIGSDFCSLGLIGGEEQTLKWKLATGNLNEQYRSMADRAGRGLSGSVAKVGRAMPIQFQDLVMKRRLHEYPLLLCEKLRSAYAVPLMQERRVVGVLLAGDRKRRIYRPGDREQIMRTGERIARILAPYTVESPSA